MLKLMIRSPLKSLGDISAMYSGATCIAVPIPKPKITLPIYAYIMSFNIS